MPRAYGTLGIDFLVKGGKGGPLTAMRVVLKPRGEHASIRHARTAEFFVVLKGGMSARIAGRSRQFRAGDYAYLPPGTSHAFRAGPRGLTVLSIFTPALDMGDPDIVPAD